ncbi:MAG: PTS sugar transporter subunit IIA [Deltaproteobacteria bacterium]|nr:PTS sugar transporter subunit IIA [Deltaproteobacteria bacterium]
MPKLSDALQNCVVALDVEAEDKPDLLMHLADRAAAILPWVDADGLYAALLAREREASTGIGNGVAIPHASMEGLQAPFCLMARLARPMDYDAIDHEPVRLLFLLASPASTTTDGKGMVSTRHVKMLARLARLCMRPGFIDELLAAATSEDVLAIVRQEDGRHV